MQTTFIRLQDDSWGIKGVGLTPGDTVSVYKKDGSTTTVTVGEIVSKPVDLAVPVIARVKKAEQTTEYSDCAECGARGATIHRYDSSGIAGLCCRRCARLPQEERSFA